MGLIFNGNGDVIKAVDGSLTVEGLDLGGGTNINAGIATFSGNVNVGGVLTYEDVKNVDSVGVVTARAGIVAQSDVKFANQSIDNAVNWGKVSNILQVRDGTKITFGNANDMQLSHNGSDSVISQSASGTGNLKILSGGAQSIECVQAGAVNIAHNGNTKLATTSTGVTVTGDITISDKIIHAGDTNTAIRFPAADTFSVETAGQQNVQVNGTRVLLKSPSGTDTTVRLQHQGNSGYGDIILDRSVNAFIIDNDPGNAGSNGTYFSVKTIGSEKLRIDSGGSVTIGDAATHTFSAHSEGDDLVVGGAGWRGMTIYGEGGGGVIQFADNASNRIGQIVYNHGANAMDFRVNGNSTRLKITGDGHTLFSGLTDHNDSTRNVTGITIKSTGGVSFQNYGSNNSRNWRIRPDDMSRWGDLDVSVSPTTNSSTDWPDAAADRVLTFGYDKNVTLPNGNLVIGTAGKGIDFSATGDSGPGTMSNELLDDYEEGSFALAATSNATMTSSNGTYTKIGRIVVVKFHFQINQINSGSTTHVTGLPFSAAEQGYGSAGYFASIGNFNSISPYATGSTVYFNVINTNNSFAQNPSILGNSSRVDGSITYTTN